MVCRRSGFWGERGGSGEHRTEVTEVTEELRGSRWGMGVGAGKFLVDTGASGRGKRRIGESIARRSQRSRRGIWVGARDIFGGERGFWARKARTGESIARRSRRGLGLGLGLVRGTFLGDSGAFERESRASRKASHRGHGGVGGSRRGLGWWWKFLVDTGLLGEKYASFA
jgi:hypothetical protein